MYGLVSGLCLPRWRKLGGLSVVGLIGGTAPGGGTPRSGTCRYKTSGDGSWTESGDEKGPSEQARPAPRDARIGKGAESLTVL